MSSSFNASIRAQSVFERFFERFTFISVRLSERYKSDEIGRTMGKGEPGSS